MASSSFETAVFSSLGDLLKHLRKQKELKQGDLEEKYGVDQSTISRAENNQLNPTDETLRKLATAYGIDFESLRAKIALIPKNAVGAITLDMGMLHGIASAPLIAMLMDGELRGIRCASTVGEEGLSEDGLNWWKPGERPSVQRLARDSNAQSLFAGSLQKALRDVNLDIIVASAEMFKKEIGPGGRLIRCAQISTSYSMIHLVDLRRNDKIPSILKEPPILPINLLFPHGSIGIEYKDILTTKSKLREKLKPQYYLLDQPLDQLPKHIDECFENEDHFCVLAWPPRSSALKKEAKEKGWSFDQLDMGEVLNRYSTRLPVYSVDLLLNRGSDKIAEWIRSGDHAKFFDLLIEHTSSFSADQLRQESLVVEQVSEYLGMKDKNECCQELGRIEYNVLFYPEFLKFLDDVRDKRAV